MVTRAARALDSAPTRMDRVAKAANIPDMKLKTNPEIARAIPSRLAWSALAFLTMALHQS